MLTRRFFQLGMLLGANRHLSGFGNRSLYQGRLKGYCVPVINCHSCPSAVYGCPLGTLQHFAIAGSFPFYVLGSLGLVGVVAGAMPCGTLCPFGFVQDLLYKLRSVKIRIPPVLRAGRYVSLVVLLLAVPWFTQTDWFCRLCPVGALEAALPWAVMSAEMRSQLGGLIWLKGAIAALFLVASVPARRPFCQVACPLGALLGLLNRVSLVRLRWDAGRCAGCEKCLEACPMEIRVRDNPDSVHCIRCLDCTGCEAISVTTPFGRGRKEDLVHGGADPVPRGGSAA